jgi:hypothetical protein
MVPGKVELTDFPEVLHLRRAIGRSVVALVELLHMRTW